MASGPEEIAQGRQVWAEALRLLETAIELPSTERAAWLDALPPGSPGVRRLLERLLRERGALDTARFLERSATLPELAPPAFEAGQLIGPYRLVRPLGQGGMAVVWLAERADAAHRRPVALKLPQLDRGRARAISERFLRERAILSDLAHPNITSVLDAGSDGSQPWLAMEYVDGLPLNRYGDVHRLDLPTRLRLFVQVLRAVQHAHAHGVIHRDLKPGNVLVDTQQKVKLLDFGVAKLLEDTEAAGESTMTRWGGRPLTPDYASPEQTAGQSIGTASDIYSLGVMLHELLVGRRPQIAQADAGAMPVAAIQPRRPSRVARGLAADAVPGLVPEKLARQLAGDLDTITLKALQRDPEQRYATVAAFAEDVERHLQQRPILARPDSAWYHAAKFTARHRVAVAASAVVALTLVVALATTLRAAAVARAEGARAEATKQFLVGLFDNSARQGSAATPAYQVTGKQLLDAGAQRLLDDAQQPPELRVELLQLLGDLSEQLDLLPQARRLIAEAANLTAQLHGDDDPRHLQSLLLLAEVDARASDWDASLAEGKRALAGFEQTRPVPVEALAQTRILLGNVLDQLQRHDESRTQLEAAVALLKEAGSHSDQRSRAPFYLARAFEAKRQLEQAEAQYLDGISEAEKNFGPRSYIAAFGYENYGDLLRQMARFDEAQRFLRRALDVYAVVLGPDHLTVSGADFELAEVLWATGRRDEADALILQAIAVSDRVAGPFQPNLGGYQTMRRAELLTAMGRLHEAHDVYASVLDHWPPGDPNRPLRITAIGLGFGRVLITEGDFDAATTLFDEVERGLQSRPADDFHATSERLVLVARRAETALARADAKTAHDLLDAATRQPLPTPGGDFNAALAVLDPLSRTTIDAARARRALDDFDRLGDSATYARADVENRARLDHVVGRLTLLAGDAAAARVRLERAVAEREAIDAPDSPWLADARLSLAECLVAQHEPQSARALVDRAAGVIGAYPRAVLLIARLDALRGRLRTSGTVSPAVRETT
jgi:serine/threonine-protein kinase